MTDQEPATIHSTEYSPLYRRKAIHYQQNTCTDVHLQASQQLCRSHGDCNITVIISHLVDAISKDNSVPDIIIFSSNNLVTFTKKSQPTRHEGMQQPHSTQQLLITSRTALRATAFYSELSFSIFPSHGQHDPTMRVKYGTEELTCSWLFPHQISPCLMQGYGCGIPRICQFWDYSLQEYCLPDSHNLYNIGRPYICLIWSLLLCTRWHHYKIAGTAMPSWRCSEFQVSHRTYYLMVLSSIVMVPKLFLVVGFNMFLEENLGFWFGFWWKHCTLNDYSRTVQYA